MDKEEYVKRITMIIREADDDTEYLRAVYTFAKNYPHKTEKERE